MRSARARSLSTLQRARVASVAAARRSACGGRICAFSSPRRAGACAMCMQLHLESPGAIRPLAGARTAGDALYTNQPPALMLLVNFNDSKWTRNVKTCHIYLTIRFIYMRINTTKNSRWDTWNVLYSPQKRYKKHADADSLYFQR